jgi:hypothetical protein
VVVAKDGGLIPTPDRFESNPPPANGIWIAATTSRRIQSGLEAVLETLRVRAGTIYSIISTILLSFGSHDDDLAAHDKNR